MKKTRTKYFTRMPSRTTSNSMHIGAIAGLYFIGAGVLILPVHLLIEQSFNINLVLVSFVSLLGGSFLSWIFKKSPEAKELDRGLAHRWEWREVNTGNCLKNKSG